MSYITSWQRFIYLLAVTDVFGSKVVGWRLGERMTSDLEFDDLNKAVAQRKT